MSRDSSRTGISLYPSRQVDVDAVVRLARLAEELGYDSIWIPETWGVDAVSMLAVLARETERIRLASGVLNVYSRSAALIAQTAATLQEISDGRFILGLGASGPRVVEGWHGVPYGSPLGRQREYVAVIRTALAGERVDFHGEFLRLAGFKLRNPPGVPIPIYIAALGPRNVRLTGEIADGWLPIFAARGHLGPLLKDLAAGAEASGRALSSIEVAAYIPAVIGPRADSLLRQQIAYYVGAMGTFYAEFVGRLGFTEQTRAIRERWESGDRTGAVAAVEDSLLELFTLGPDPHAAVARLRAYRAEGVSLPILAFPHGCTADEIAISLEALSPRGSA